MKFEAELRIRINDVLQDYRLDTALSRNKAYTVLTNWFNREFVESRITIDEYKKAVKIVVDIIYKPR